MCVIIVYMVTYAIILQCSKSVNLQNIYLLENSCVRGRRATFVTFRIVAMVLLNFHR